MSAAPAERRPRADVIDLRGVQHRIRMPSSPTVCLELHDYIATTAQAGAPTRGIALAIVLCLPTFPRPDGLPTYRYDRADLIAERMLDYLLGVQRIRPRVLADMVDALHIWERLEESLPLTDEEVSEAAKNS